MTVRLLGAVLAVLTTLRAPAAHALSHGITGYSGKQDGTCNRPNCHGGGTEPVVKFEGPQTVSPGALVTFRFIAESQSATQVVAGFNVAASAGVLGILPLQDEQLISDELTHTAPKPNVNGRASWEFTWQAPSVPGPQTLYGASLSANDDGRRTGDLAATATLLIAVAPNPSPTAPVATPTPTRTPTPIDTGPWRGDANCDDALSASDVTAAVQLVATGQRSACGRGDMDCNAPVDDSDVTAIIDQLFAVLRLPACVE